MATTALPSSYVGISLLGILIRSDDLNNSPRNNKKIKIHYIKCNNSSDAYRLDKKIEECKKDNHYILAIIETKNMETLDKVFPFVKEISKLSKGVSKGIVMKVLFDNLALRGIKIKPVNLLERRYII